MLNSRKTGRATRRLLLQRLALLTALALVALAACDDDGTGQEDIVVLGQAFTSGVASADVTSTSALLWTRAEGASVVTVDVSADQSFEDEVRTLEAQTSAERDFTAQVRVDGLTPDTPYYYRFRHGDQRSFTGTFVTAPADDVSKPIRFVFSGDSDGSRNPDGTPVYNEFEVLGDALAEDPAFFLYFGDTIYADRDPVATTLDAYRAKYRQNREYLRLSSILQRTAIYTIWDDHEVENDFAGATVDPALLEAGRQAFREYMPIDDTGDPPRMYRSFRYGKDLELIILDQRSYRDASAADACLFDGNPDPVPGVAAPGVPEGVRNLRSFVGLPLDAAPGCLEAIDDPARTMLGDAQKQYFLDRLAASDATWKVVVNEVPVQMLLALPYDRWEGYAAERREVLRFIRDNGIKNVVFLTTDFHANIFGPVRVDNFTEPDVVAYEAVAGPIATAQLARDIEDTIGKGGGGALSGLLEGVVGVDCAVLDAYAYGLVEVDPASGAFTITAKDQTGRELCKTELEAQS